MSTEDRWIRTLLRRAIRTYGTTQQIGKAIEEMSELTRALCRYAIESAAPNASDMPDNDNWIHAVEELADVRIMLRQLEMILNCEEEAAEWEERKLLRLRARLDESAGQAEP